MTDTTPRLLTMKPYEWEGVERTIAEHSALEPSYVDALHSEVLEQAARVQALEQELYVATRDRDEARLAHTVEQDMRTSLEQERDELKILVNDQESHVEACEQENAILKRSLAMLTKTLQEAEQERERIRQALENFCGWLEKARDTAASNMICYDGDGDIQSAKWWAGARNACEQVQAEADGLIASLPPAGEREETT